MVLATILFRVFCHHGVLHGFHIWYFTAEAHKLSILENRLLRRIFEASRLGVTGGQVKLHNEEICDMCCSPCNQTKEGKIDVSCSMHVSYKREVQGWSGSQKIRDRDTVGRLM